MGWIRGFFRRLESAAGGIAVCIMGNAVAIIAIHRLRCRHPHWLGTVVASRVNVLRRLFSPARQMRDEVQLRARAVFFDRRVHHTACATGIMLYISLFERMAIVLADQTVLDRLGQDQIDAMCAEFTQRLQMMQPIDALAETVQIVGQRLSDPLPRKGDDINELSDALVILN